jgi:hypothetical protein
VYSLCKLNYLSILGDKRIAWEMYERSKTYMEG